MLPLFIQVDLWLTY